MEEINLEIESSHKNINLNTPQVNNGDNNIEIIKDIKLTNTPPLPESAPGNSNIGIDLLINKNKTSGEGIEEFKPKSPVKNDSILNNNINVKLDDIGNSNLNNINTNDINSKLYLYMGIGKNLGMFGFNPKHSNMHILAS